MFAKLPISKQEADRIMEAEKEINEKIKWQRKPPNGLIHEFSVPLEVKGYNNINLTMIVNKNVKIKKYSFTIVYNGAARIKALDIGKGHKNPPDRKINVGKKHKHTWTNEWKDQWAYQPDDITDGADFRQIFNEFLLECNIKCNVELPDTPPYQEEMIFNDSEMQGGNGIY